MANWLHAQQTENDCKFISGQKFTYSLEEGEEWFWDCLFDADAASNSASWQWVAGTGTDSTPYFRIFNPVTQGQKFDPNGDYIKQYIPELKNLPIKFLFCPWIVHPIS